ncbi:MAG: thioredoxin domain-containing protein [Oligoflexia bacterium]|nr:thioredoxin domain-containing protein [Oligoflexia bacterium]
MPTNANPAQNSPTSNGGTFRLIALMLLALIGLGASIALSQHFYELRSGASGFKSYCNISSTFNCDVVATSSWAEALPGLPVSSVAAGWYAGLFFLYLIAMSFGYRKEALRVALTLTAFSAAATLFYLYLMIAQIGTYCLLCLGLDAINFVSLAVLISLKPTGKISMAHWKGFSAVMAISLFVAVVGLKGLDTSSESSSGSSAKERAESIMNREITAISVSPDDLMLGPANAGVTIVEFSDFQCPFCRIGAFTLHAVMSRFPKDVRVVMKPFPLDPSCNRFVNHSMHPVACEAARAAVCAAQQGHFEGTYEAIFQNQESLAPGKSAEYARQAGANPAQLASCMASNESLARIQATIEEANQLKVQSTPTFYINGRRIEGVETLPVWTEVIQRLLR